SRRAGTSSRTSMATSIACSIRSGARSTRRASPRATSPRTSRCRRIARRERPHEMPRLTMPRAVALGGAVLAIVAFFLPWVQSANATYSGASLASAVTGAGGLRGFDTSLYAIPVIALVSIVLALFAGRAKTPESEARLRILAIAASIAGLAVALLFLGSAVLGGAPDIVFAPGRITTDLAVTTSVAK